MWMNLSLSLPGARALTFNFPILPLLCPCFLEFLSTSFPLPSLLIRGTPQRWRIIPIRSRESFMSWEDTLARALLAPFPLHRYLHQLPSLALPLFLFSTSLPWLLLSALVFSPMFMFSFIMGPIGSAVDVTNTTSACLDGTNTTQTPGSGSISRCWSWTTAWTAAPVFCVLWMFL